jgi:hypothetical protein
MKDKDKEYCQTISMKLVLPYYGDLIAQQKRNLYTNFCHEYRHKNSWQSSCKKNYRAHYKDHTPSLSWFPSRDSRMFQHMQINKCNIAHK